MYTSVVERLGVRELRSDLAAALRRAGAGERIVITAGASAPELLVNEIIDAFRAHYDVTVETVTLREENVSFKLPRELREAQPSP